MKCRVYGRFLALLSYQATCFAINQIKAWNCFGEKDGNPVHRFFKRIQIWEKTPGIIFQSLTAAGGYKTLNQTK
jgi:hypothetical protein